MPDRYNAVDHNSVNNAGKYRRDGYRPIVRGLLRCRSFRDGPDARLLPMVWYRRREQRRVDQVGSWTPQRTGAASLRNQAGSLSSPVAVGCMYPTRALCGRVFQRRLFIAGVSRHAGIMTVNAVGRDARISRRLVITSRQLFNSPPQLLDITGCAVAPALS